MNKFSVIDVETANADYTSICQVGIVDFDDDKIVNCWSTFINPRSYFDPFNISIHGIKESDVEDFPHFTDAIDELRARMDGKIVLHHGHFDRTAFTRSYNAFGLPPIECRWLDSTKIVRRTWEQYAYSGYGLANLAAKFGIEFQHHNALEDCKAAGQIILLALQESKVSIEDWLDRVKRPISTNSSVNSLRRDGNPEAPFFGEKIVFTGNLRVLKAEAADIAQRLGFDVQTGVTRKTTHLCVGIQDTERLAGYNKSSKHRKAESLAQNGSRIEILSEEDFWSIARSYDSGEL